MATPVSIELNVHFAYDEEANVWYVAQSDIPGLRLEADNPQHLMDRVIACAPEMIELNQGEILKNHAPDSRPQVSVRPVFDSPLQLACA